MVALEGEPSEVVATAVVDVAAVVRVVVGVAVEVRAAAVPVGGGQGEMRARSKGELEQWMAHRAVLQAWQRAHQGSAKALQGEILEEAMPAVAVTAMGA